MDLLYWTNLNLRDKIEPTQKLFFNKYSYRVQYYCPGSSYLRDYSRRFWGRPDEYLEFQIETQKNYRAVGSWYPSHRFNWTKDVKLDQIESARTLSSIIKHRIEEPNLAFYTTDENTVKLVVDTIKHTDRILHLNIPDPATLVNLNNNTVYMKRGTGYQYKIFIRDKWTGDNTATSFLTYLDNLGEQVKISQTVRKTLEKNTVFSSIWFYSNDLTFLPMLELIYPNCVLKVQTIKILK